jgi:hypothetical protein
MLNAAVFAPMPSAMVMTASAVNVGVLVSVRIASECPAAGRACGLSKRVENTVAVRSAQVIAFAC